MGEKRALWFKMKKDLIVVLRIEDIVKSKRKEVVKSRLEMKGSDV